MEVEFEAVVYLHPAGSWWFAAVPVEISEDLREMTTGIRRGFGSLRVRAAVGSTVWQTSIFPESSSGRYVLPVKAAVRRAESLEDGRPREITLELLDLG